MKTHFLPCHADCVNIQTDKTQCQPQRLVLPYLPIDIENPYQILKVVYRYISILISYFIFHDPSRVISKLAGWAIIEGAVNTFTHR